MVAPAKTDMGTVVLNDNIIQTLKIDNSTLYLNINWKGNAKKVYERYNNHLKQLIRTSKMQNSPYSTAISKEEVYEQSTGLSTKMCIRDRTNIAQKIINVSRETYSNAKKLVL